VHQHVRPGRIAYTRTRTLEVTPDVLERHRLAAVRNDRTSDPFRLLRTQVLMQMRQNAWQTLAVTSPNRGAGKSTVALNLALSFAMEADHTALLVDADLRDPYVRDMLELEPGPGLVDYLLGDAALEDLLIHPNVGNLVVLPGGAPVANSSELMRSPMMADLIRELRGRYRDRLIVFDVPPILVGADTLALSPLRTQPFCSSRNARPGETTLRARASCSATRTSWASCSTSRASFRSPSPSAVPNRASPALFRSRGLAGADVRIVLRAQSQAVLPPPAGGVPVHVAPASHGDELAGLWTEQSIPVLRRERRYRHRQDDDIALFVEAARAAAFGGRDHRRERHVHRVAAVDALRVRARSRGARQDRHAAGCSSSSSSARN
jgi:Mrp family chromosome partitioning ATPase